MIKNPIYVAGLERSGTSLMFALLASHPNIAMSRRTNLWTHFYNQYGDLSKDINFERCLKVMMTYKRVVKLDPDPDKIRAEFREGERSYARLFAIIEGHFAEKQGKVRWGDKSLNTERYGDPIVKSFPQAKILHMMRDPRDRYASARSRWKVDRGGAGAATAMWLSSFELGMENLRRFPKNYMIIRYETLTAHPEETMREICDFIEEPYREEMFEMGGSGSYLEKGGNSSYGGNLAGRISTRSVGKFRQVLSASQVAFIQNFAGREMEAMSYEHEPVDMDGWLKIRYTLGMVPFEMLRMGAWRLRKVVRDRQGRPVPSYRIVSEVSSSHAAN